MTNLLIWLIFGAIWILTFIPSWQILLWLLAYSSTNKNSFRSAKFICMFVLYRLLIALPYIVLLLGGDNLPNFIKSIVIGLAITGLLLSIVRFFLARNIEGVLWNIYGLVYDGLLNFYPYRHLLTKTEIYADIKSNQKILDLGCGTGNFTVNLLRSSENFHIDAVDSSVSMLNKAKSKIKDERATIINADVLKFLESVQDKYYDRIVLINVVYAVNNREKLWEELIRTLQPNGKLIFTTSDKGGSWPIIQEHLRNDKWYKLVNPMLIAVFVIDLFISKLASVGQFQFVEMEEFEKEIHKAGGNVIKHTRCYGGEEKGVNVLALVARV